MLHTISMIRVVIGAGEQKREGEGEEEGGRYGDMLFFAISAQSIVSASSILTASCFALGSLLCLILFSLTQVSISHSHTVTNSVMYELR